MFELTEHIQVDYNALQKELSFIAERNWLMKTFSVAMTTLAFGAFALAALFLFIHTMNTPVKAKDEDLGEEELERRERLKAV